MPRSQRRLMVLLRRAAARAQHLSLKGAPIRRPSIMSGRFLCKHGNNAQTNQLIKWKNLNRWVIVVHYFSIWTLEWPIQDNNSTMLDEILWRRFHFSTWIRRSPWIEVVGPSGPLISASSVQFILNLRNHYEMSFVPRTCGRSCSAE